MFFYQNEIEKQKNSIDVSGNHTSNTNITIIFNGTISIQCPLENATYLSRKVKKIVQNRDIATMNINKKEDSQRQGEEDENGKDEKQVKTDSTGDPQQNILFKIKDIPTENSIYINIEEKNSSNSSNIPNYLQSITEEMQEKKEFYQKQLSLLFNGYDISISNEYLPQFKTICKLLQISSFLNQLKDYYELPEIHETQHEITVLRTLENFFFSLTEDNIETNIHQIWSLFYQTRPEFFCLILLNQCLIKSKSIELFVYIFEEILHKIDKLNELINGQTQNQEKQSISLQKLLESIIRKSLKFEGTYGPYKPESDLAHEMFPQEYFYLCQVLYSRGLISKGLFTQSFINANWITISNQKKANQAFETIDYSKINISQVKIFITEDQYITIEDFSYDFRDKNCRYKHMNEEEVEKLISQDKSRFIHKKKNKKEGDENDNENEDKYVNWISLFLEGDNPDSIAALLRKDDIEKFQWFVNNKFHSLEEFIEKHGKIRRSIYERKSVVNKNLTLIEYAAFYGSVKCFKYLLMNECKLDKAAKYAVAGSNSEIIHICQQHKATFEGSLLLSIRYHRWEITEWLLETLNVEFNALLVVKLCISCGNFLSLHFIIEKILSQKAGSQAFIDEIVTAQAMFRLKFVYGYLMTKYKVELTIGFDDNNAIFWHENFFSYLFDGIKPREIRDESQKQSEEASASSKEEERNDQNEKKNEGTNASNKENDERSNQSEKQGGEAKQSEEASANSKDDDDERSNPSEKQGGESNESNEKDKLTKNDQEAEIDDDYDYEDEINETLRHLRPQLFYEIPPEMIELIVILQNRFFQINSIPYRAISPLHAAIGRNDIKLFMLLHNHSELDLNKSTYEYPPPLLYSMKLSNEAIFKILCRDPTVNPNGFSSTVTFMASEYDPTEEQKEKNDALLRMLDLLLQNKRFDPNAGTSFTQQGIFSAFDRREYRLLDALIKSPRVSLNSRNMKGQTLLHLAILNDDKKLFDMLLNAKERVDLNLQTRILASTSDIYKQQRLDKSPLLLCIENKRWEMFDRLIENDDVDITIRDDQQETVLMFIVKNIKNDPVCLLKKLFTVKEKEFIESMNIRDWKKKNLLEIAKAYGSKEVISFLTECQKAK